MAPHVVVEVWFVRAEHGVRVTASYGAELERRVPMIRIGKLAICSLRREISRSDLFGQAVDTRKKSIKEEKLTANSR